MNLKKSISIKFDDEDYGVVQSIDAIHKISGLGINDIILAGISAIINSKSYSDKLKTVKQLTVDK